jgi:predicted GTPase
MNLSPRNVIVFGETGAGKSSIVNMLEGDKPANVSDQAKGVTFTQTSYAKRINGSAFKIFDTIGLNEGKAGTVEMRDAIKGLYNLVSGLEEGVSLLVYVMRAPRIRSTTQQNYEMFYKLFCREQVPIVIVITGLEDREEMDSWWMENEGSFRQYEMRFGGHACITATKGKRLRDGTHAYEAEYGESKRNVEDLIHHASLMDPWKMPTQPWFSAIFSDVFKSLRSVLGRGPPTPKELRLAFQRYGGE